MKLLKILSLLTILALLLCACTTPTDTLIENAIKIELSDSKITLDGETVKNNPDSPICIANDIIYYESGKDFTYGEGTEKDAHTKEEADAHTVLHITKAGTYLLSGKLSFGQIAIDLGKDAKEDPKAIVTLILNNLDITCTVAPAVIFYNVYECGNTDEDNATKNVDTKKAGANVIIADGTKNTVNGSYVEKIYKPDSVVLNDDGTEVEDATKLHKYDGAFYSKMSMNINGGKKGNGILNIKAENEGLDSELHLTINDSIINIKSGNDGINTNEDGISVTTINDGELNIQVTGETGEGDGIDSNGWLVINGGSVTAMACSTSGDAGIDSDMGIHINGGTVIATGSMLDRIESAKQNYAVFNFLQKQSKNTPIQLKNKKEKSILDLTLQNAFSILIYSSPDLKADDYTLWSNSKQLQGQSGGMMGGPGMKPGDMQPPEGFENMERPESKPPFEGVEPPTGEMPPEKPNDDRPQFNNGGQQAVSELSTKFEINAGANTFSNIIQVK